MRVCASAGTWLDYGSDTCPVGSVSTHSTLFRSGRRRTRGTGPLPGLRLFFYSQGLEPWLKVESNLWPRTSRLVVTPCPVRAHSGRLPGEFFGTLGTLLILLDYSFEECQGCHLPSGWHPSVGGQGGDSSWPCSHEHLSSFALPPF
jgi:hypothetical protein